MAKDKKNKLLLIILMLMLVCILLPIQYFGKPLVVNVKNNSNKPISNISISYSGGSFEIPELATQTSQQFEITPSGETSLMLSYYDNNAKSYDALIDIYIEQGYSGKIDISIGEDGTVSWEENLRPW